MDQDELHRLEAQCIQEQPPACAAACPIHVDARGMIAEAAKGSFDAAAKIFRKTAPFPGIVSRVCDQPCQGACRRGEAGGAISIRAIERACVEAAAPARGGVLAAPRKDKRVAVVGGGLCGLTAAFDLGKKGWSVVVFEKRDRIGGSLWNFAEGELPREVMAADFKALEAVGVAIRAGVAVEGSEAALSALRAEFDAVFLAGGAEEEGTAFGLPVDGRGRIAVDPLTYASGRDGVFAGGGMLRGAEGRSPIQSIADGRRAATSIDRYLQGASLTGSRSGEGSQETRLYTSLEGVEPSPVVPMERPEEGYSREEAAREAQRCIQCQCLECVKVCEYLKDFGSYPRKYVRQIYNNLSIVMGVRRANKLINSCSLCGLCKEACPEDLHMGDVCKEARRVLVRQGKMPPSAHHFPIRDMVFSNGDKCALARHAPGTDASRYLFYPGCRLSGSAPERVREVYAVLREGLEGGVGLMLRCCGAPADWSGREELFRETLEGFAAEWRKMGKPKLVLACSTCYEAFKTHLPEAEIISLWTVLDEMGLPKAPVAAAEGGEQRVVAVHDACTTRHEAAIHERVRSILRRAGIGVEELALSRDRTECCGYGGLMSFANAELAGNVARRRIAESPLDYVAYCAVCRDYLSTKGKRTPHLLDLALGATLEEAAGRRAPGLSESRENRARLKRGLLKELWGESVGEKEPYEGIALNVSDDVRKVLEERRVLDEDAQQVVEHAERTGAKIFKKDSGRFLAHYKHTSVTFWVEYSSEQDGSFTVHNAYSHRMEIVEGEPS